jgi:hypothetical protein
MALHGGPSPSPFYQPSSPLGRLLAVLYKSAFVAGLVFLHLTFTTPLHRAAASLATLGFVLIETCWTTIADEDEATGAVSIKPPSRWAGEVGHSSFAQFWSNVLWTPMILHGYRALLAGDEPLFRGLRVVLFPLCVPLR